MFSDNDLRQMQSLGIDPDRILEQISLFSRGIPFLKLDRPATASDGIIVPDPHEVDQLCELYQRESVKTEILKFVPASGAATRMFKDVYRWQEQLSGGSDPSELMQSDPEAAGFFTRIREFAFWDDLLLVLCRNDLDGVHLLETENYLTILNALLSEEGLAYASLPKGLIAFHKYGNFARTSFEEHLAEAAMYACGKDQTARIHLTVSSAHLSRFQLLLQKVIGKYAADANIGFDVRFSLQKPSTDTIAVTPDNHPYRMPDGSLMFRPGGHGALIENLNDTDASLVFIKNIDNVVQDHLKEPTIRYKKALGGLLIKVRERIGEYLRELENDQPGESVIIDLKKFALETLSFDPMLVEQAGDDPGKWFSLLNRPVRVCGMVKNQGEPGGGPFWVRDPDGNGCSLQIVESSQLDVSDPGQKQIFSGSTHFNPVDLVCSLHDYKGRKFDLRKFVDPDTAFISAKTHAGKPLKALELPGLWNGAMAKWISLFVEVPLETFNPVKTINDLLRPQHLGR